MSQPTNQYMYLHISVLAIAILAVVISVVTITIVSELVPELKTFLTELTGHHWLSKGIMALAVFSAVVLIGSVFRPKQESDPALWSWLSSSAALLGTIVLFLFFIGHYISK